MKACAIMMALMKTKTEDMATVSLFSVFGVLKKINKNQTGRPAGGRAKSLARIIVRRRVVITGLTPLWSKRA